MTTTEIIAKFNSIVDSTQDYTLMELKKVLSEAYKATTTTVTSKKAPKAPKAAKAAKGEVDSELSSDEEKPKKRGRPAKTPKLDANGEEKKKREPSAYNIFIKEKYANYKLENPEMSAKEIMLLAAAAWTASKQMPVASANEE